MKNLEKTIGETAVLGIDPQNCFCPGGELGVENGDQVIPVLNTVMAYSRRKGYIIVLSGCWHPAETDHFKKWPPHGVAGTYGAQFHKDLQVRDAVIVRKGTLPGEDAYSAFDGHIVHNGVRMTLEEYLRMKGITCLIIGGLATDYCVLATALDAIKRGFKVILLLDACRAVDIKPGDGERAIEEMKKAGVIISDSASVLCEEE